MGTTAIISPQIIDSTSIGRDLITSVDAAAGRAVLEIEDASYNWAGDHVFEGSIEATNYAFTAGQDGQLSHPDLGNSIYVRFNNADVFRFNALDFWPVSTGTKNLGRSDHEWANVYSVAGAFSGTVTANAFVGDGSGLTNLPGGNPFDQDLNTTDSPSFVNGSFSGNLNTEVGGSQRVYNSGTEGDADTEALVVSADGTTYDIFSTITGTGAHRRIDIGGFVGSAYRGLRLDTANGILDWQYNNATKFKVDSSTAKISSTTTITNDIRPDVTDVSDNGTTLFRWANVYSVDGSYSGNLNVESGGSQRVYNLGTEGDADTEYLETSWDANYAYIQNKATGTGVARGIKLMTDSATDGIEVNNGSMQFFVSNDAKVQVLGSSVTTINLNPKTTSTYSLGNASNRWQTAVVNGLAIGVQTVSVASPSALNAGKGVTLCDCTTTPITVSLPLAANLTGQLFVIKKIDSSSNAVTIDGNGTETIDGALTVTLASKDDAVTIASDGSSWFIVNDLRATVTTGGFRTAIFGTLAASLTLDYTDHTVLCDTQLNAITVNLPTAVGHDGQVFVIKKVSPEADNVLIAPYLNEEIDGSTLHIIDTFNESIHIQAYNGNWFII